MDVEPTRGALGLWEGVALGGGAGFLGALARASHPRRRRLGLALVWDLVGGIAIGIGVLTVAPAVGLVDQRLAFGAAFAAALIGQAVMEDLVTAWVARRYNVPAPPTSGDDR